MRLKSLFRSKPYFVWIEWLNRIAPVRRLLKSLYDLILRLVVRVASRNPAVRSVYLSGSLASGGALYGISDIDLVVVLDIDSIEGKAFAAWFLALSRWTGIFGKTEDVSENLLNSAELEDPGQPRTVRIYHAAGKLRLLHGPDLFAQNRPELSDFYTFLEAQFNHYFGALPWPSRSARVCLRKAELLRSVSECAWFKERFEPLSSPPGQPLDLDGFVDFCAALRPIPSSFSRLDFEGRVSPGDTFLQVPVEPARPFGLLVPFSSPSSFYAEFQDSKSIREALTRIDPKLQVEIQMSVRFGNFQVFTNRRAHAVFSRWKHPYLWNDPEIEASCLESLQGEYRRFYDTIKKEYYVPFVNDRKTDPEFLKSLSEAQIITDAMTIRIYGQVDRGRICASDQVMDKYSAIELLYREFAGRVPVAKKISLCICTKNRAAGLDLTLASIVGQTLLPDEVIVVDHASQDETQAVLARYQDRLPLRVFVSDLPNLTQLRDFCVKMARFDVVAFTDDDVLLFPDWMHHVKRSFESDPHLKLLGGVMLHWKQARLNTSELFHRHFLGTRH